MKLARIHDYGGPENVQLEDAPDPLVGPGQLLVRVRASSVNPVDWKVCAGALKAIPVFALPQTPGGDIAGTVEAVGEGVSGWQPGDDVYAFIGLVGAYAEKIAISAEIAAPKPAGLSFEEAASIPLVALTAFQGLLKDGRDLAGLHVLVHGASGGVGSAAVQIAKAHGARVTASASDQNAGFVRDLGANVVVDFRSTAADGLPSDVDVLVDCVGDSAAFALWPLIAKGGSFVRLGAGRDDYKPAEDAGIRVMRMQVQPNKAQLDEISGLVAAGKFRPVVSRVFPFAEVQAALALSKTGKVTGKIALSLA